MDNIVKAMASNFANKYTPEYLIGFLDKHPRLLRSYSRDIIETKLRNQIEHWKYSSVQYNHTLLEAMQSVKQLLNRGEINQIFILTRQALTDHLKSKAKFYGRKFH